MAHPRAPHAIGSDFTVMAAPTTARKRSASADAEPPFRWREIARNALVSRALDDLEEATNKNRANVPRDHLILYQFSARGHEVAQAILGSLITHRHDAASAYYRNRPDRKSVV